MWTISVLAGIPPPPFTRRPGSADSRWSFWKSESAGPIVSIIFFVLLFLSGVWFPLTAGSGLAKAANYFPVHHLIRATAAPCDTAPGASPYAWHDLLVVAISGAAGLVVAVRRFQWEPHRR